MTIIESWEKSKQLAIADTQKPDVTEDWRSMRYAAVTILSCCIAEFQDATTPREPEPEWFGTGPCQHPAWWIKAGRYRTVLYGCRVRWNGSVPVAIRSDNATDIPWEELEAVVPVELEGYPAPVGWQVLERNNA